MKKESDNWQEAVALICQYNKAAGHLDQLLDRVAAGSLHWLIMETFRNWFEVGRIMEQACRKSASPMLAAHLRLSLTELLERPPELAPKVVHHAVEQARKMGFSRPECGFVNAVLRRQAGSGKRCEGVERARCNHPDWLRQRWINQFGEAAADALMQWNQLPAEVFFHNAAAPSYGQKTPWNDFYRLPKGALSAAAADLKSGQSTIMDPFARIPVQLLRPQPRETIWDLCAAPGGKSRLIAQQMQRQGSLLCVEKGLSRMARLKENLAPYAAVATCLHADVLQLDNKELHSLTAALADGILLDVPCSNTGVMRRRPDVKIRLREPDIAKQAEQQLTLLTAAAHWVRPGGRLVYSTCSLETEENERVVAQFIAANPDWQMAVGQMSLPWRDGHDGGGAFLLTRK